MRHRAARSRMLHGMGAPSKRAKKIRKRDDFDLVRLVRELLPPKTPTGVHAWSLEAIKNARDDQLRGHFKRPAQMAASTLTDDAIFVAHEQRLAPQRALPVMIQQGKGARAVQAANEADALYGPKGIALRPETLNDINAALAVHGLAVAYNTPVVREDGSRIDLFPRSWPMEFVRWDSTDECLKTQTRDGLEEKIVHGDGRWIVFANHEYEPWKHGALLPIGLVWARHALGNRDWLKGSKAHGDAKIMGEMPMGVPLQKDGVTSREAAAFMDLLKTLFDGELPIGIRPAGSKVDFVSNNSTAWQVWKELTGDAKQSAARIYLGTDGILGAKGGAPGVGITALFGIAARIVEGDLGCIERGLDTGLFEPWTALNYGDSASKPTRKYLLPDADEEARHEARSKREAAFHSAIKSARDNGFAITQEFVDDLAKLYRVTVPSLAETPAASGTAPLRSVAR